MVQGVINSNVMPFVIRNKETPKVRLHYCKIGCCQWQFVFQLLLVIRITNYLTPMFTF